MAGIGDRQRRPCPRKRGAFRAERFRGVISCGRLRSAGAQKQSLGEVAGVGGLVPVQVGHSPPDAQGPVVAACREHALLYGPVQRPEGPGVRPVWRTPQENAGHFGVEAVAVAAPSGPAGLPSGRDARGHYGAAFAGRRVVRQVGAGDRVEI
jgi:hypothetical protein